jgi:shikimate kinase
VFDLQGLSVYLVGMMGSGKSTVGPLLAANLGYSFLDTDTTIARACATDLGYSFADPDLDASALVGKIITEIFQTAGEAEFRRIETQILAEVSAYTRLVIATGGGIVIDRENWNHLHQGLVIWLDPSVDLLVERLQHDTSRPILATPEELKPKLERIRTERRDRYAEADIHIPFTDNLTPEEIVDRILTAIPTVLKTPVAIPE